MGSTRYRPLLRSVLLAMCSLVCLGSAHGMTPAAPVVEMAVGKVDQPLAGCVGMQVRRGAVHVSKARARWLAHRGKASKEWHAPRGLKRLEEVRLFLLLRSPERCEIFLSDRSEGRIPESWQRELPFRTWALKEGALRLRGRMAVSLGGKEYREVTVPQSDVPSVRLYHHGLLEIHWGLRAPRIQEAHIEDVFSFHLEGPGDEKRFLFRSPQAGLLIVERTPGNMPNLDLLMGDDEGSLKPGGSIPVAAGRPVWVVFRYRSARPVDLDAGFLFTPDLGVTCEMDARKISMHAWRAGLTLHNGGSQPAMLWRPSPETVEWYAGGKLIAAARPGRPPTTTMLGPESTLRYEVVLSADIPSGPDSARVDLGGDLGVVVCSAGD